MSSLQEEPRNGVHMVLVPSAGMGHLTPFSRLSASLSKMCEVTMVSILPTVSSAESSHLSDLFSNYPQIHSLPFQLPPFDSSAYSDADPFYLRFQRINQSVSNLMTHLLSNTHVPVSGLIIDITLSSSIIPLAKSFGIPCYVLFTSSASMLSFLACFPNYYDANPLSIGDVEIPGLRTIPVESIPQALHNPQHLFTSMFVKDGRVIVKADGLLVNTFESFEKETLEALRGGFVKPGLPPVISIGPLMPVKTSVSRVTSLFSWLEKQSEKSVVYVSFGSRTTMPKEQIRELGLGLEESGCRFLWVVKTTIVDKEDETNLDELLGAGFLERVKDRGLVTKGWVEQEKALGHKAVGGFISHCGWNSVTESAINGVRILAWPRAGDQRINADVVARSGLGIWPKEWSWDSENWLVTATDIGKKVKELMADEGLMEATHQVGEEARKAAMAGGSSAEGLLEIVRTLNK